jgi:predicted nucleic acid-binding protein
MAGELLLDTSALVSLLDRSQPYHEACVDHFEGWQEPVVSTEAVLTEATHLLGRLHGGRRACLDFFLEGGATLIPLSASALQRCRELIEKYSDLPMDFADATLVTLAEEVGTDAVFTTDSDFKIYRASRDRPFWIYPPADQLA